MRAVIGRFEIAQRLGAGGFATVWLAYDPELDAPVAVKVLAENWAEHADVRRRFTEEARLLRRVDNDRLVRVYDVGTTDDGRPYLVMSYADLGSLADRTAAHPPPWPPEAVLDVVDAVAAGLEALHAHGVVHRDVGPRNILFRRSAAGEAILLGDLGIAKDLRWASGLTQPAGTAGYQAPEQTVVSAGIGPATDVHALARTAAELLDVAGPPWSADATGAALARATAPDPADRTATPAAFAAQLRAALHAEVPSDPPPVLGHRAPGRPRRRLALLATLVTVVLLLGGTAVWALTPRETRFVSATGKVAMTLAGQWAASPILAPGEITGEGMRLVAGNREIGVAYAPGATTAEQITRRTSDPGCAQVRREDVATGRLRGVTEVRAGCPGGAAVTVTGLTDPDDRSGVVWLEVRSVDGTPTTADVLDHLSVRT